MTNRQYYFLPHAILSKTYKSVIYKLAKLLRHDIDEEESMRDIEEAFKIEDKIAHVSMIESYLKILS